VLELLRELRARLQTLDRELRQLNSIHVNREDLRAHAREAVDYYFRNVRDRLLVGGIGQQQLEPCDRLMHSVLEATHKRTPVVIYRTGLRELASQLLAFEKGALLLTAQAFPPGEDRVDRLIIETLSRLLPSAARSYEQAVHDLTATNRFSWRGPAADLRESLRETLDHLAPDGDVMAQAGFKLEKEATGPTMKQKVRFVLRSRGVSKGAMEAPEAAVEGVETVVGTFVRSVYTRSNISTHTPTDKNEVMRVRDWVRTALCELLEIRG